ncbi:MAG: RidA family protein [Planctomycetes bacterium]|nr:RidA family protein [Planctomycetota bacterium]
MAIPTQTLNSPRGPEPVGPYPHAKRVGNLLFVSGLGPRQRGQSDIPGIQRDLNGHIIDHDIAVQCRSVFENLRMVIEDAGARWEDVIDVTVFLTHIKRDFAPYNKVFAEFFAGPGKPNPTRTTVEVAALPTSIAIEVKAIVAVE